MSEHSDEVSQVAKDGEIDGPRINNFAQKFLDELNEERDRLSNEFPLCALLIEEG